MAWEGGGGGGGGEEGRGGAGVRRACGAWCHRALAVAGAAGAAGASGAVEAAAGFGGMALRGGWPRVLQILQLLREQGIILAVLLGLSAFFSMAETSITTLWPWKVRLPTIKCHDTNLLHNV